ncbi:MAG: glycosyltransferase family 2 protein, partial [Alkaliphilus sp.]|nr:glycosyltransferase family 2 protein [Alkaliphilus sp.]
MKIAAIVPAFNEEKRICNVLEVLSKSNIIDEIIVVDDGSSDNTYGIARLYTKNVLSLSKNIGKGGAIIKGLQVCDADIMILLDADLVGLTEEHILNLLMPVIKLEVDTTVGVFQAGRLFTDLAQKIAPFLSGQRVITKSMADDIHSFEITKYGFEVAISRYIKYQKLKVKKVVLFEMTHVMKEEKMGLIRGSNSR